MARMWGFLSKKCLAYTKFGKNNKCYGLKKIECCSSSFFSPLQWAPTGLIIRKQISLAVTNSPGILVSYVCMLNTKQCE